MKRDQECVAACNDSATVPPRRIDKLLSGQLWWVWLGWWDSKPYALERRCIEGVCVNGLVRVADETGVEWISRSRSALLSLDMIPVCAGGKAMHRQNRDANSMTNLRLSHHSGHRLSCCIPHFRGSATSHIASMIEQAAILFSAIRRTARKM